MLSLKEKVCFVIPLSGLCVGFLVFFTKGPVHTEVGEGNQSIPYNLSFFLDRIHMLGVPGQPGWGEFLHVKAAERGSLPNRGNRLTAPRPAKTHRRTTWPPKR